MCEAGYQNSEVIVLDDGSTDDTAMILDQYLYEDKKLRPQVYGQSNQGRFQSRLKLANLAKHEKIIFCDSRLKIDLNSFAALNATIAGSPDCSVIGGIRFAKGLPLVSYFWLCLEKLAWRQYEKTPKKTVIDLVNFNKIPKGTTLVFLQKKSFIEASNAFMKIFESDPHANDDTLLFRQLAKSALLIKDPFFSAQYVPRTTFQSFLKHAYHRGKVISDGYFHSESRSRLGLYSFLLMLCAILVMLLVNPLFSIYSGVFLVFSMLLFVFGQCYIPKKARFSFVIYLIPFSLFFGCGMVANFLTKLTQRRGHYA
jgi:glycosyltransferase involved in cell wall biosynthesis